MATQKDKVIALSDANSYYIMCEMSRNPWLRDKPAVVAGDMELRHGIVLSVNPYAKKLYIQQGMLVKQALEILPHLVVVKENQPLYMHIGRAIRKEIYNSYSDYVEAGGIDEAYIDLTKHRRVKGDIDGGAEIANEIRARTKDEFGVPVSVGVSFTKEMAKLASELKKPDGTTVITRDNYKDIAWPLPIGMLYQVGDKTAKKLITRGIRTIGDMAKASPNYLEKDFGIISHLYHYYANGVTVTDVAPFGYCDPPKSIGHGTTTPHNLNREGEVAIIMRLLSDVVGARMREFGYVGKTLSIMVRDSEFGQFTRQAKLKPISNASQIIYENAMAIFRKSYDMKKPVRKIGISISDLCAEESDYQSISLFDDQYERIGRLERAVDSIRDEYGFKAIRRGCYLKGSMASVPDPRTIKPDAMHSAYT